MPRFSSRFTWDLSLNQLTVALARRRLLGLPVLDLSESNPTKVGFAYPEQAILGGLSQQGIFQYQPEPFGLREARESVARYYASRGASISPGQVVLTASTSEAYSWIFQLLCDPGDEVLVPRPSYPLFDFLARLQLCRPSPYTCWEHDGTWLLDQQSLAIAAGRRCRALITVHPNNPTGHYGSRSDRLALEEFAVQRGMALIADEVFYDFAHIPSPPETFAANEHALTFTLCGLSKIAALPQLKLAWMVVSGPDADKRQALERLEVIADTYLSVGTPVQWAAATLLEEVAPAIQATLRERLAQNLETLRSRCREGGLRLLEPEGGWYAVVKAPKPLDEEACVSLLEQTGVHVHPASFFGFTSDEYVVASLLPPVQVFSEAFDRLLDWLPL